MASELGERARSAVRATGRAARAVLVVVAEGIVAYQNSPIPCSACQRTFIRKEMHRLNDIPAYANSWLDVFCDDCCVRLRATYRYQGVLEDERRKLLAQLKRAMDRGLPATLTLAEWEATLNDCGWKCAYCPDGPYEAIEHVVPIELGGGTTVGNCVPACKTCNSSKGARHPDEIRESSRSPAAIERVRAYLRTRQPPPTPSD